MSTEPLNPIPGPWPVNTPIVHLSSEDLVSLLLWGTIACGDVLVAFDGSVAEFDIAIEKALGHRL